YWHRTANGSIDRRSERMLPTAAAVVTTLAFTPDGHRLAVGDSSTTIRLWDVSSGQESITLQGDAELRGHISALRFSPNGKTLVGARRWLGVWSVRP
ncbi:MAG: hypothetical protein KDA60_19960, partial [Planctomycetales bacterium]|nr:hypothetical protein [Planctomycetales bacterium]